MFYVYCTGSAGIDFAVYTPNNANDPHRLPVVEKKIRIKGGANIATKNLVTPLGVRTEVSDEDMDILLQDFCFKRIVEAGFITYEKKKIDPDSVAKRMEARDKSAPITPDSPEVQGKYAVDGGTFDTNLKAKKRK
jgi:hypothetical protein